MANNSDDIRRLMNLMEAATKEPVLLEGWVDTLKSKLKGNMGEKQRRQMADELAKEWYEWLGKTKRDGTLNDMTRFMTHRIGFNDRDIDHVLGKAGFNPKQVDQAEEESEQEPEKTIKTGAEHNGAEEPKSKKSEWDPEEGVPIPDDLNTKLSDYAKYGIDVETADNKVEPEEIVDDPRKYQDSNGEWNRKLISKKLDKMPLGAKLTLGRSTFSRSVGKDGGNKFYDPKDDVAKTESINEADTIEVGDDEVLPKKIVAQIMDASAAQVNDEYLLNGPERDKDNALNTGKGGSRTTYQAGKVPGEEESQQASKNVPGKAASGQYNADEMIQILKTDFQITNAKAFVDSLTRKVMNSASISSMTDNDMNDLALLGWALIRARN